MKKNRTGLLAGATKERIGTYNAWYSMIDRCSNEKNKFYGYYGGRGISVCQEWATFDAFFRDMGEKPPGMQLDRRENNEGYSKANCRWVTPLQNGNNKRNNVLLTKNGETKTLSEWARYLEKPVHTIYSRYMRGWDVDRMLSK